MRFVVSNSTGGNVHLRASLYRAISDEAHSLALSKAIVAAKLQNSRKVVDRWARDEKDPAEADRLAARATQIWERVSRLATQTRSTMFEASKEMPREPISVRSLKSYRRAISGSRRERGGRPAIRSIPCSGSATACW